MKTACSATSSCPNCTSMLADTAHFDTHQPAENVTFVGCVAILGGGTRNFPETYGFQMRGLFHHWMSSVPQAVVAGIMLFGPVSSGRASIAIGNMIANVKAIGSTSGTGNLLRRARNLCAPATSHHTVTGNVIIKNCVGIWPSPMADETAEHRDLFANIIDNTNSVVPGAAIQLTDANRVLITGNNISETGPEKKSASLWLVTLDNWQITQNSLKA